MVGFQGMALCWVSWEKRNWLWQRLA